MRINKAHYYKLRNEKKIMRYLLDNMEVDGIYWVKWERDYQPAEYEVYEDDGIKELGIPRVVDALNALQYLGYISMTNLSEAPVILPTAKGKFYFEQIKRDRWDFIRKSVVTPFAVAVVISFITTLIARLLWP
jgi:hypothetical protein